MNQFEIQKIREFFLVHFKFLHCCIVFMFQADDPWNEVDKKSLSAANVEEGKMVESSELTSHLGLVGAKETMGH